MSLLKQFVRRVERFMQHHGVPPTRFGRLVLGDPNFVFDLRRGRKPNIVLIEQVDRWMKEYAEKKTRRSDVSARAQVCQ